MVSRESDPPNEHSDGEGATGAGSTSQARRWVVIPAIVCSLQAVALIVIGGLALADPGEGVAGAVVEAIVLALLAAGLVTVAVGILRLKAWARGPIIALQLIALLTVIAFAGLNTILGWVLAGASVAALAATLSRPVAIALEGESEADAAA